MTVVKNRGLIVAAVVDVAVVTAAVIFFTYQWAQGVVDSGPTAVSLTLETLLLLVPVVAIFIGCGIGAWKKVAADERGRREMFGDGP